MPVDQFTQPLRACGFEFRTLRKSRVSLCLRLYTGSMRLVRALRFGRMVQWGSFNTRKVGHRLGTVRQLSDIKRGVHCAEGEASVTDKAAGRAATVKSAMDMSPIIRRSFSNMKPNEYIKLFRVGIPKCFGIHILKS